MDARSDTRPGWSTSAGNMREHMFIQVSYVEVVRLGSIEAECLSNRNTIAITRQKAEPHGISRNCLSEWATVQLHRASRSVRSVRVERSHSIHAVGNAKSRYCPLSPGLFGALRVSPPFCGEALLAGGG